MMAKKSNSDGCGCGKPKCSGCNKYRAGGMLTGGQKRLDKNGNGKIDANDFEMLRKYMSGGMLKDYMSGGMLKDYMSGGMVKKYAVGGPVEGDPKKETEREKMYKLMPLLQEMNRAVEAQGGVGHAGGGGTSTDVKVEGLRALESLLQGRPERPELCLLYTSPSPRDRTRSRMPSSA